LLIEKDSFSASMQLIGPVAAYPRCQGYLRLHLVGLVSTSTVK
jgi:hypothetical protein